MKIIIKTPDQKVKKFRLQQKGYESKRFLRASTLMDRLVMRLSRNKLKEKLSIVVKYDNGGINETIVSSDSNYLVNCTSVFLEDFLSKSQIRKYKHNQLNYKLAVTNRHVHRRSPQDFKLERWKAGTQNSPTR